MCEVTGDNDPEHRWIPIEAGLAFKAAINYWGMVAALMAGPGIPRLDFPETILQVRIDGRVYRVRAERALAERPFTVRLRSHLSRPALVVPSLSGIAFSMVIGNSAVVGNWILALTAHSCSL